MKFKKLIKYETALHVYESFLYRDFRSMKDSEDVNTSYSGQHYVEPEL